MRVRSSRSTGSSAPRRAGSAATVFGLLAVGVVAAPSALAAEFCSDNIMVSRVGDGSSALTNAGTAVFLDEYTRAGTFVQTIALPIAPSGADRRFVTSGSATSNLGLARSSDGAFLTLAGYDAAVGTAGVANSTSAAVNRVVARVDGNGVVDTTTALTDAFSGDNVRSAVTDDGSRFWLGGAAGGVRHATLGATTSNSVSTTNLNMRWVTIQGGQLYVSSGSGANTGLNQVGTGLPTTAGQTATRVIDTTNGGANSSSPYGAVLLDRSAAIAGLDTAYLADDQGAGAGGLRKYSFNGTTWTAQGRITATLRGIAGVGDAASATLWVTTTGNLVQTLTDPAAFDAPITGSLSTIVTGAANTAVRGIALAPTTADNCGAATPTITDEPGSTTISSGQTATLSVVATGTAPLSYQWYVGTTGDTANPVSGATSSSFTTPPLTTTTTSYWVRVSNTTGTDDSQTATVTVTVTAGVPARIHDIQGAGHLSPFAAPLITDPGQAVTGVPGVVTARRSNGFYIEDPVPDADPATSEGIFVFTASAPPAAASVGNLVSVSGTVTEFRPGCDSGCAPTASAFDNLTVTEIENATVTLVSTGATLPVTTVGGPTADRTPPLAIIEDDASGGNVENGNTVDPATDGLDFSESLESMQIRIDAPEVVSRRSFITGNHREVVVVPGDLAAAGPRSPRGGIVLPSNADRNPERIFIADDPRLNGLGEVPTPDVGDSFSADVTGIMFYDFGNYVLLPSQALPSLVDGGLPRETTSLLGGAPGQLTVGTFTVENLDFLEDQAKFDGLAGQVVTNMGAPDIVVVQEIQDDNGETAGGVSATQTWNRLIAAIDALPGGPTYEFRQIDPVNNQDGGAPNGNIRQGFLFRTDRGVAFVDRPGATSTTANSVQTVGGDPQLAFSPGRIDPANTAFNSSRKPLVGEFTYAERTIFVVGNHWNSKGGDDAEWGRFQPPVLTSEVQRQQQAILVRDFIEQIQGIDPDANIVVAGDLDDFPFSAPVTTITDAGYTSLVTTLPVEERYGFVFDGNSQVLDHIVVSNNLVPVAAYDTVHVNAEFEDQLSDHDPSVARLAVAGAVGDTYTTSEDTPLTVPAPGVLGNDTGGPLTATLGAGPANGTVTLNADGSFTYTPALNFAGPDTFTYTASNGPTTSAPATVTITVGPILPACTITGTPGKNTLVGTPGDDVICGLGGDDPLFGRGGNDVLLGGPGHDTAFGDAGNDQLRGDDGTDLLIGGTGNDVIFGGAGNDVLNAVDGVAANDTIRGGTGRDRCTTDRGDTATSCP